MGNEVAMAFTSEHLDTICLLQAMYPLPEELVLTSSTAKYIDDSDCESPVDLELTLRISLDDHPDKALELYIALSTLDGQARITPRQPDWLNRTAHQSLSDSIEGQSEDMSASEYILETIEHVKNIASRLYGEILASSAVREEEEVEEEDTSLERVWFWFPMLSTREKRKDLVDYAPRYNLTGFVLAGKCAPSITSHFCPNRRGFAE